MQHAETAKQSPGIAVIGIGNILLKDEGIGVHTVQRLKKEVNFPEVEIIDAGTSSDVLMLISESVEHVIIIDAATAGGQPGDIYRFTPEDIDTSGNLSVSLHQNSLVSNIKMVPLYGRKLESVTIFGVEPGELDFGLELSPIIESKTGEILALVKEELTSLIESMEGNK